MSRMRSGSGGRRPRRQFSEEFKDGAVRLVLDEGKTVGAVARELDLTASALSLCVRQARAERTKSKSGLMKEEREGLTRLRKEVRELRLERDLLKKVSALFAETLVDSFSDPPRPGSHGAVLPHAEPRRRCGNMEM
jgi:transposase